jgi:hypothetical protein
MTMNTDADEDAISMASCLIRAGQRAYPFLPRVTIDSFNFSFRGLSNSNLRTLHEKIAKASGTKVIRSGVDMQSLAVSQLDNIRTTEEWNEEIFRDSLRKYVKLSIISEQGLHGSSNSSSSSNSRNAGVDARGADLNAQRVMNAKKKLMANK